MRILLICASVSLSSRDNSPGMLLRVPDTCFVLAEMLFSWSILILVGLIKKDLWGCQSLESLGVPYPFCFQTFTLFWSILLMIVMGKSCPHGLFRPASVFIAKTTLNSWIIDFLSVEIFKNFSFFVSFPSFDTSCTHVNKIYLFQFEIQIPGWHTVYQFLNHIFLETVCN